MALDLTAMLRLSHALQLATRVGAVVQAAQDAVLDIAGYTTTFLSVIQPGTPRTARVLAIRGSIEELVWEVAPVFLIDGDAMLEEVLGAAHPVVVSDARTDPRTNKQQVEVFGNRTMVHVPMMLGIERVGALTTGTFGAEGVRPPTAEQLESLVVIATLVAAAILRVRVQEELADSQQTIRRLTDGSLRSFEQERLRISRELHDGVGQLLVAAQLQLTDLEVASGEPLLAAKIDRTRSTLSDVMDSIRSLSHDLRPASLDALGLPEALRELAESCTTASFEVDVQLQIAPDSTIPEEVAISLFRVAQIALTNVVRHAQARRATITLKLLATKVRLEISDQGIGFDPARAGASRGIGLIGIRERMNGLNGRSEIVSAPGEGTRVAVEVPLKL
jgi:signal transduction histidine kinase